MLEKRRNLYKWQWYITYTTFAFSVLAIGLAFADQKLLSQLTLIPITICLIVSIVIAYQRFQLNKVRRDEVLSEVNAERDRQLLELFDNARKERNLPPDAQSRDGYTAAVQEAKARAEAAAERERQQSILPPGIKRRGGNNKTR